MEAHYPRRSPSQRPCERLVRCQWRAGEMREREMDGQASFRRSMNRAHCRGEGKSHLADDLTLSSEGGAVVFRVVGGVWVIGATLLALSTLSGLPNKLRLRLIPTPPGERLTAKSLSSGERYPSSACMPPKSDSMLISAGASDPHPPLVPHPRSSEIRSDNPRPDIQPPTPIDWPSLTSES